MARGVRDGWALTVVLVGLVVAGGLVSPTVDGRTPAGAVPASGGGPPSGQPRPAAIHANFTASPISGQAPVNVSFVLSNVTGKANATSFAVYWAWGDNTTAYNETGIPADNGTAAWINETHVYSRPGTFHFIATIRDNAFDGVLTETATIVVMGITAAFHASATSGPTPLHVWFNLTNINGSTAATSFSVLWRFGDRSPWVNQTQIPATGGHVALVSMRHWYNISGTYDFIAEVQDNNHDGTLYENATISAGNQSLVVTPEPDPVGGTTVGRWFNLTLSPSGGVAPYSATWNQVQTGCSGSTVPLTETCAASMVGSFTLSFIVHDSAGASASGSYRYAVNSTPLVSVSATSSASCQGAVAVYNYTFSATTTDGTNPFAFNWSFDDGSYSTGGATVYHDLAPSGAYNVTVVATAAAGATAEGYSNVTTSALLTCASAGPPSYSAPTTLYEAAVGAIVAVIVVLVIVLVGTVRGSRAGRRRGPPPAVTGETEVDGTGPDGEPPVSPPPTT